MTQQELNDELQLLEHFVQGRDQARQVARARRRVAVLVVYAAMTVAILVAALWVGRARAADVVTWTGDFTCGSAGYCGAGAVGSAEGAAAAVAAAWSAAYAPLTMRVVSVTAASLVSGHYVASASMATDIDTGTVHLVGTCPSGCEGTAPATSGGLTEKTFIYGVLAVLFGVGWVAGSQR